MKKCEKKKFNKEMTELMLKHHLSPRVRHVIRGILMNMYEGGYLSGLCVNIYKDYADIETCMYADEEYKVSSIGEVAHIMQHILRTNKDALCIAVRYK